MGRKAFFNGKVYKIPTAGAGLEPGTVDWELRRRQIQAQSRREDKGFKSIRLSNAPVFADLVCDGLGA